MSEDLVPGSRPRVVHPEADTPKRREPGAWDAHPREYVVGGKTMQLFPVGALARALNRDARTIHSWEYKGWFPKVRLRGPRRGTQGLPGHRLYSRTFIEGVVTIAADEGILDVPGADIKPTNFSKRVFDLFEEVGG